MTDPTLQIWNPAALTWLTSSPGLPSTLPQPLKSQGNQDSTHLNKGHLKTGKGTEALKSPNKQTEVDNLKIKPTQTQPGMEAPDGVILRIHCP